MAVSARLSELSNVRDLGRTGGPGVQPGSGPSVRLWKETQLMLCLYFIPSKMNHL